MTDITYAQVWSDHAISVGEVGETVTVTVMAGDTVYFGDSTVSAASNQGSLTVGGSTSVSVRQIWLRSASTSFVKLSGDPTTAPTAVTYPPYIKVPSGATVQQALAGWYAAKTSTGTVPAIISVEGDSICGGYTLTDGIKFGWPRRLKTLLQQSGGYNWYGDAYSVAPYIVSPQQIATTEYFTAWHNSSMVTDEGGIGRAVREASSTGVPLTTLNIPAGAVECVILSSALVSGTWGYKIDGGTTQTVNSTPTTGGTLQQNTVLYKTTIPLNNNSTIQLGFQNANSVFLPQVVGFRFATSGIGLVVHSRPAGSMTDLTTQAGTVTSSVINGAAPGSSYPDDKTQPFTQVTTAHNTAGAGWPLNPNLVIIAHYANVIGRGSDVTAERRAMERYCRAIRKGNANASFIFLINSIPDELYTASETTFYNELYTAEQASQTKSAIADVAFSFGGVIVDIDQKWGETPFEQGFLPANNVHPTGTGATVNDGQSDIAQSLALIV